MATYLMGAITFCPHPPFNIHAITYQPIVNQSFYDGPWIWPSLDFGVYPSGIIYDKERCVDGFVRMWMHCFVHNNVLT